jgi:hypothetical protein
VSPETVLSDIGARRFDFVKVDVEGFEHRVVDALLPLIRKGRVGKLLLDYHASILAAHGVEARTIHAALLDAGMQPREQVREFSAYVLYESGSPAR